MNLLDRANSFLKGSGKKLALTVVPLAMLAAPAARAVAVSTFNVTDWSLIPSSGASVSSGSLYWETVYLPWGTNGISLYSDEITGDLTCGGSACQGILVLDWSGDLGSPSLSPGQPILLHWDFSASPDFTWAVFYDVGGNTASFSGRDTVAGGSTVEGWGSLMAGSGSTWEASITFNWDVQGDESGFSVTVPGGFSDDLDPSPEPATFLLLGPALGLLVLKRRRARR
jgi:hypothetical protein